MTSSSCFAGLLKTGFGPLFYAYFLANFGLLTFFSFWTLICTAFCHSMRWKMRAFWSICFSEPLSEYFPAIWRISPNILRLHFSPLFFKTQMIIKLSNEAVRLHTLKCLLPFYDQFQGLTKWQLAYCISRSEVLIHLASKKKTFTWSNFEC